MRGISTKKVRDSFKLFHRIWRAIFNYRNTEVQWSAPRKVKIVFYDVAGLELFVPIFGEEPYEIIYVRREKIYITPGILWNTIVNLARVRPPLAAYALALVQYIRPAIVVTFNDNEHNFGIIAQHYSDARFLAFQNGLRPTGLKNVLEDHPQFLPKFGWLPETLSEFACFGQKEVDQYTRDGIKVDKFYPIGSLRDSYYREYYADKNPAIKYDVCLVSTVGMSDPIECPDTDVANRKLATYFARFVGRTKKTVVVAGRNDPTISMKDYLYELQWYRNRMGEQCNLMPNNSHSCSTFSLQDSSAVSVSFCSTALYEAFGRERRVLFCNFTNSEVWDVPEKGIWSLGNCSYEEFEERLLSLLAMTDEEFQRISHSAAKYVMNYDKENPPIKFLRNLIAEAVKK